jgi:hypothetical protein
MRACGGAENRRLALNSFRNLHIYIVIKPGSIPHDDRVFVWLYFYGLLPVNIKMRTGVSGMVLKKPG